MKKHMKYLLPFCFLLSNSIYAQIDMPPNYKKGKCYDQCLNSESIFIIQQAYNIYIGNVDSLKNIDNIRKKSILTEDGFIDIIEVIDTNETKSFVTEYYSKYDSHLSFYPEWKEILCEYKINLHILKQINTQLNKILNLEIFSSEELLDIRNHFNKDYQIYCLDIDGKYKNKNFINNPHIEKFINAFKYYQLKNLLYIGTFTIETLDKLEIKYQK